MTNEPVSHAAKRAEAHEARAIGLPEQGRSMIASSSIDALIGTRDELRRELDAASERALRSESERDIAWRLLDDYREQITALKLTLDQEKREHAGTTADLDAAKTHLDVTGEAECECGDHIRPLGEDRCSWCESATDKAGW